MARIYDVVCLTCGEVWGWCKYDAPDHKCEKCGAILDHKIKEIYYVNGCPYDRDWDYSKVKVFGVWSTNDAVEHLVKEIKERNKAEDRIS